MGTRIRLLCTTIQIAANYQRKTSLETARTIFSNTKLNITSDGKRHKLILNQHTHALSAVTNAHWTTSREQSQALRNFYKMLTISINQNLYKQSLVDYMLWNMKTVITTTKTRLPQYSYTYINCRFCILQLT